MSYLGEFYSLRIIGSNFDKNIYLTFMVIITRFRILNSINIMVILYLLFILIIIIMNIWVYYYVKIYVEKSRRKNNLKIIEKKHGLNSIHISKDLSPDFSYKKTTQARNYIE